MRKVNLTPERVSAAIVIAAVITTAPRHVISALQMEGVVISGIVWSGALAILSLAFAALEGLALLQIENAQAFANDSERRRLSIIKWLVYISIPATFIAPLVAQSQHVKVSEMLSAYPVALWILAALNVSAPMFVISAAAASGSVLAAHARAQVDKPQSVTIKKPPKPESTPESAPPMPPAPEPERLPPPSDAQEPQAESAPASAGIDRERLAAMLSANPNITSGALAEAFKVSAGRIRQTPEWKAAKEARS